MSTRGKFAALILSSAALIALSSVGASARVVCNEDGDCWHVTDEFNYPPGARVIIHPDDWRWEKGQHYVWREHPGRGFWERGEWRGF